VCLENKPFCKEHYGEPFKERSKIMGRLCDKAGVKPFGFYAIGHLSASILYNLGYEVAVIQAILRHKSANTTERYLRSIGLERVREALEDLKPSNAKVLKFKSKRKSGNKISKK
jgi:integrase